MSSFNIVEYDAIREGMEKIKQACNFLPDTSTKDGYEKSKRIYLDYRQYPISLEKRRKELNVDILAKKKLIDSEAKELDAEIHSHIGPHKEAYQAVDREKKAKEAERIATLSARVTYIRDMPNMLREMDSASVMMALDDLNKEECTDFYEMTQDALIARSNSREELGRMLEAKLRQEEEAVELERLRAESAARAEKDKSDQIKAQAIESERLRVESAAAAELAAEKARSEDLEHKRGINRAAVSALLSRTSISDEQALQVVTAIARGDIPSVLVRY